MTIAARINQLVAEKETDRNTRCFALMAKYVALGKGDGIGGGLKLAERARALPKVVDALKAVAEVGTTGGSSWGDELVVTTLSNAFLASLRTLSVFDAMRSYSPELPPSTKFAVVTSGATGATVNEAMVKPVSKLSLSAVDLDDRQKTLSIVVVDEELLRVANVTLFQSELERAVAAKVDEAFITKITTSISPTTSNGGTSTSVLQDISAGLAALSLDAGSKVFCATSPDIMKALAFKVTSTGERAFPELTINGGNLSGVEFFPTSGVTGQFVFFDASQIAHYQRGIELDTAKYASVQMDTVGDSPQTAATPLISLWQNNLVGVKATRWWDAARLRDTAVSVISSVAYTGDSPN